MILKDNGSPFHFYAKFIGGATFGYARSETYESYIQSSNTSTSLGVVPYSTMPSWFITASKMWHDGQIRDVDYSYGISNLIDYKIVKTNVTINSELKLNTWLKHDAEFLVDGKISSNEYSHVLEYLLDNKII